MKRLATLSALILALASPTANAAGLNLRWNQCEGDGGVQNLNFACDTNAGLRWFASSFTLDSDMRDVQAAVWTLYVSTAGPSLAPWWELRGAGCRVLGTTQAMTVAAQDGASCPDLFALAASMSIASYVLGIPGPNGARILGVNAVPNNAPAHLLAADNPSLTWGLARCSINNQKTVGTPSCSGCSTPACLVFGSLDLHSVWSLEVRTITGPSVPGSDYVTWQGGGGTNCPAATPTRNATWGGVKSLYR